MVEFHEDHRAEDDNGRSDDEDDRGHGQILLVSGGPTLHRRQRRHGTSCACQHHFAMVGWI